MHQVPRIAIRPHPLLNNLNPRRPADTPTSTIAAANDNDIRVRPQSRRDPGVHRAAERLTPGVPPRRLRNLVRQDHQRPSPLRLRRLQVGVVHDADPLVLLLLVVVVDLARAALAPAAVPGQRRGTRLAELQGRPDVGEVERRPRPTTAASPHVGPGTPGTEGRPRA